MQKASEQIMAIPDSLIEALHSSLGACLVMHCLIVSCADQDVAQQQLVMLKAQLKPEQYRELVSLYGQVKPLPRSLYLPAIELAIPSLRQLSGPQFQAFMSHLHQLMQTDGVISLFEWCLFRILRFHLHKPQRQGAGTRALQDLEPSINVLYSALASAGSTSAGEAKTAFDHAFATLGLSGAGSFSWSTTVDLKQLDMAFDRLLHLAPLQKPRLLKGMVRCIEHDGIVTADEVELIRTAAAILDCPMPPLTLPVSLADAGSAA